MSLPSNVPELAVPKRDGADEAEINRCIASAAQLVHGFSERGTVAALDAMLAAVDGPTPADTERARAVAASALQQTVTLHKEVGRFLSLTKK